MTIYAVCYDLNKSGQNYDGLIAAIKKVGTWWHYLDSTWLVSSNGSSSTIRDYLMPFIDANDELLVVALRQGDAAWAGISNDGSAWLQSNLS